MSKLHELFPTAESLLELTPDTLAPVLLRVVAAERQRGMFWPPIVTQVTIGSGMTAEGQHAYPYHKQHQVDALVAETFELLRRMGMIHPAPDTTARTAGSSDRSLTLFRGDRNRGSGFCCLRVAVPWALTVGS